MHLRSKLQAGLITNGLITSISSRNGENGQETLFIVLELVTVGLPQLSWCATINTNVSIALLTIKYVYCTGSLLHT